MKILGLVGILFAAVGGVILSPVQFAPAIIIVSGLAAFAFFATHIPSDFVDAERRLQRQIDSQKTKLSEIERNVDERITRSTSRIEIMERGYGSRLSLNEQAIDGLASSLEQRYLKLEHDFLKKIVRIEQRLKVPAGPSRPALSLVSTGLLAALALLIAIPLWWNFPFKANNGANTPVVAQLSAPSPALQPEARAQLRAPVLDSELDDAEQTGKRQGNNEAVLGEIKQLLASTVRPLEKCVDQVSSLRDENQALSTSADIKVQKLESKLQACSSKLQVTQKIMKDQRRVWFGDENQSSN